MTVEIVSVCLKEGIVTLTAIDCSEENLQRFERTRDDGFEKELEFLFDTHNKRDYLDLYKWIKEQKATRQARTWGEAIRSVNGTVTTISCRHRVWD